MSANVLFSIFAILIGLCIGSFLNVVALRGLSGESIIFPPSKCPKCSTKLSWYTNIPVISYIFLLGKCKYCKESISIQYPIVEAANAILYLAMFLNFGLSLKTLFLCAISSIFVLICITDFKEHVVIDLHTYILMALALLYNILHIGSISIPQSFLGLIAGYLIFELLAHIGTLSVKTRAFGEGDTLIAMGLGAFFGLKMLLFVAFLSIIIQAIFALPALFVKYIKNKHYGTAFALLAAVLCIICTKLINTNSQYYLIFIGAICLVLFLCLFVILKTLKNRSENENFYYMPFGPAMVASALIMIFFSQQILNMFI